jgi:trichohyalin
MEIENKESQLDSGFFEKTLRELKEKTEELGRVKKKEPEEPGEQEKLEKMGKLAEKKVERKEEQLEKRAEREKIKQEERKKEQKKIREKIIYVKPVKRKIKIIRKIPEYEFLEAEERKKQKSEPERKKRKEKKIISETIGIPRLPELPEVPDFSFGDLLRSYGSKSFLKAEKIEAEKPEEKVSIPKEIEKHIETAEDKKKISDFFNIHHKIKNIPVKEPEEYEKIKKEISKPEQAEIKEKEAEEKLEKKEIFHMEIGEIGAREFKEKAEKIKIREIKQPLKHGALKYVLYDDFEKFSGSFYELKNIIFSDARSFESQLRNEKQKHAETMEKISIALDFASKNIAGVKNLAPANIGSDIKI